jgi:hypothetical protein
MLTYKEFINETNGLNPEIKIIAQKISAKNTEIMPFILRIIILCNIHLIQKQTHHISNIHY